MTLETANALAGQIKPILECAAIVAGLVAIVKWLRERSDRATDVLLQLEQAFEKCKAGRSLFEDGYKQAAAILKASTNRRTLTAPEKLAEQEKIDELLRFYVVLVGVRKERQVSDASLSACYRFWMAHYYRHDRAELRRYINYFFPTLRTWLLNDACLWSRLAERPFSRWWRSFFRPGDFWTKDQFENNPKRLWPGS